MLFFKFCKAVQRVWVDLPLEKETKQNTEEEILKNPLNLTVHMPFENIFLLLNIA